MKNITIYLKENELKAQILNKVFSLSESKLSRLLSQTENDFFIISAFRDIYTLEQNIERSEKLKADIRKYKLGFVELVGFWDEKLFQQMKSEGLIEADQKNKKFINTVKKTLSDENATELSFFVPYNSKAGSKFDFEQIALQLMIDYDQQAIIFYFEESTEVGYLWSNGTIQTLGKFSSDKMWFAYSKLRYGKNSGRKFMFGIREANNSIEAGAMVKEGYLHIMPNQNWVSRLNLK